MSGIVFALVLAAVSPGRADVLNVGQGEPYSTIQAAINDAGNDDTINVGAATYPESLLIEDKTNLTIVGAGAGFVAVTGGVVLAGTVDGLVLEGLTLMGDAPNPPGAKTSVIDSRPITGSANDITIRKCVLDGENTGKFAFYGHYITGTWTFQDNEIKNFSSGYVIDNAGSQTDAPVKLSHVVFTGNHIHDVAGSIAFRGKIGEEIETAVISNNLIDYSMITSSASQCWAAIEINTVLDLTITDNVVVGVPEANWGGEGQAFRIWNIVPWTVDIHGNRINGCFQGLWIVGLLDDGIITLPTYVPGGSIYNNDISGNSAFGLWISDVPAGSAASSALGGPLNAENNWWGAADGPSGAGPGTGDAVSANIDYDPWLTANPLVNILKLNVQDDPAYLQPGEIVVIDMDALNLAQHVTGCQAILNFRSAYFLAGAGEVDVQPGGGIWNELIWKQWDAAGDLDVAVGVDLKSAVGTKADGTVAKFTLTVDPLALDGTTDMVFRPDVDDIEGTFFADLTAQAVYPGSRITSQTIVIDGTDPVVVDIKASQSGGPDLTPSGNGDAIQGPVVDIAVQTSDNLSGVAGAPTVTVVDSATAAMAVTYVGESPLDTFNYTVSVQPTTADGAATITVSGLTDNAGNVAADVTDTFDLHYIIGMIGDFVWNDTNHDGVQDAYEPGIPHVNILLKNDLGAIIDTTTTDGNGLYRFTELPSGTYTVVVDENTLPPYFSPSLCNQGNDDTKDNDCSPVDVTLPDDFTGNTTIDFGYDMPPCELDVIKVGCVIIPPNDCHGGVVRMTLQYTGQGCDAGNHNQVQDNLSCTGDPNSEEPVSIVVSNERESRVWASATNISVGDLILVDAANAARTELERETLVKVFDANGYLIQEIMFDTSCSQPLNVGDQFGSMFLISLTTTEGGEVTFPENPDDTCITELPPTEGSGCNGAKIRNLRLRYLGGGCAQTSHSQPLDAVSCWDNGESSPSPVRIYAIGKQDEVWLDTGEANVEFGDIVELAAANSGESQISSEPTVFIFDANDELIEEVAFHTSCSYPLNVGDQFGSLQIFGMETTAGGVVALAYDVEYTYTITNTGSVTFRNVTVVDDMLGEIPGSPIPWILPGDSNSVTLTLTALVSEATTNCVDVTGTVLESDFNVDGIVNFEDFAHFSLYWWNDSCMSFDWCDRADMGMNGIVDISDLATFSEQWLLEYTPCQAAACATITQASGP